jgi:hypothetical protein
MASAGYVANSHRHQLVGVLNRLISLVASADRLSALDPAVSSTR